MDAGRLMFHFFCLFGAVIQVSRAWRVTMPSKMKGLRGSCLVIPCKFDYSAYPPRNPLRVVWYQYVNRGYPLVCDDKNPSEVIEKFRWKTRLCGSPRQRECSLMIDPLELSHHAERIYTWVDPDYVTRHYYRFFDKAVEIDVADAAEKPEIHIVGAPEMGQRISVQCNVYYSCPKKPPAVSVDGSFGEHSVNHSRVDDGRWKMTAVRTWILEDDEKTVSCKVTHPGGRTAAADVKIKAACSIQKVLLDPKPVEFLEGVMQPVTCRVSYSCSKRIGITWNYGDMQVHTGYKKMAAARWEAESNITFIPSTEDDGRYLTCAAHLPGGATSETSLLLHVKGEDPPSPRP
ncbi:hypothetical protein GN956_G4373 [Arapaima gigas]